jgi:hypothetical protein
MLKAVCRYEMDKLLHSGRFVLPALLLFAYIGIAYAVAPLSILDSFSICAVVVFALMLAMGVMLGALSEPVIEQTMFVKLRRKSYLYLGKALVMAVIALAFALVAALAPLLLHILNGSRLFHRAVALSDIASGIVLFWLTGLCGGALGLLANPRLLPGRKTAVLVSALVGLLAIVKGALIRALAALRFVLWLLPPVYDASAAYSAQEYFHLNHTWPSLLWLVAYTAAEIAAYALVMRAKRFE